MSAAAVFMWLLTLASGQFRATLRGLCATRAAWLQILGGATKGPFLGVWPRLFSIRPTQVGIASTLMALVPVLLLPVGRVLIGEQTGLLCLSPSAAAII